MKKLAMLTLLLIISIPLMAMEDDSEIITVETEWSPEKQELNEYPVIPEEVIITSNSGYTQNDYVEENNIINSEPIWETLRIMNNEERANSEISLELEDNVSQEVIDMVSWIEYLWNNGNYEEALLHFSELELLTDCKEIAIANSWRKPIPTMEQSDWGTDVRIGNRDSIYVNVLDIHLSSGNLFAILLFQQGSNYYISINLSTNGGTSWIETCYMYDSYKKNDIDAVVCADHCYIAYPFGNYQNHARIRRVKASDGTIDTFPNGQYVIEVFNNTIPDSIKEVAIISNEVNSRLYYFAITANGTLKNYWSTQDATSWHEYSTGVTNADRGLDATYNVGFDSLYIIASCICGNVLRIVARSASGTWYGIHNYYLGPNTRVSSIGAYKDTITCVFEINTPNFNVAYTVSYNGGANWSTFIFDNVIRFEYPDLTARNGGGVGVVYRRLYSSQLRYSWRNYSGYWQTQLNIANKSPTRKPCIEYLGNGHYGVVYLSNSSPIRGAYFDRNYPLGITENILPFKDIQTIKLAPNPSNGRAILSYQVGKEGNVNISVYDASGREVLNLLNEVKGVGSYELNIDENLTSGFYFIKIQTPLGINTKTMTITR